MTDCYAFWSDTTQGFHPHLLFAVKPGDTIAATLKLKDRRWVLTITDLTSRKEAHFSTTDEASASFNMADWTQEDPTYTSTGKPIPYPRLTPVRFRNLKVNSAPPPATMAVSTWMSTHEGIFGPSPLLDDAFTIRRAVLTSAGAQYLRIDQAEENATYSFIARSSRWTAMTPRGEIASASEALVTALLRAVHALSNSRWPARARVAVQYLIRAEAMLTKQTRSATRLPPGGLRSWRSGWMGQHQAAGIFDQILRHILHLPDMTPSP
jgi:hypothetical protein